MFSAALVCLMPLFFGVSPTILRRILGDHLRSLFRLFRITPQRLALATIEVEEGLIQQINHPFQRALPHSGLQLTLPNHHRAPAYRAKLITHLLVPLLITSDLPLPKRDVRFRHPTLLANMAMPETSIDENCGVVFFQDNIRRTRQRTHIHAETEPVREKIAADYHLRLRILTANTRHRLAPLFRCNLIHKTKKTERHRLRCSVHT